MGSVLRELLTRHVESGTIPGGVALLGAGEVEVVAAGVASVGGGPMREDAIMRIQSMTKPITSVAALRLVEAGRLEARPERRGVAAGARRPPGAASTRPLSSTTPCRPAGRSRCATC